MQLHSDITQRAVVDTTQLAWQDSPVAGITRRLIERDGGEVARATSLVRYAADSQFSAHRHDGGEEIFVLDGVLSDQFGDYPTGTYLRNPPGSAHAPGSTLGCLLFVKLRHLEADDHQRVVINTTQAAWSPGLVPGLSVLSLAQHGGEHTALVRWAPGTVFQPHRHFGGEEIFVLDGVFEDDNGRYPAGTWLRSPHLSMHRPWSTTGCTIFVKTGHLLMESA